MQNVKSKLYHVLVNDPAKSQIWCQRFTVMWTALRKGTMHLGFHQYSFFSMGRYIALSE